MLLTKLSYVCLILFLLENFINFTRTILISIRVSDVELIKFSYSVLEDKFYTSKNEKRIKL